jgi:hypothetical protein
MLSPLDASRATALRDMWAIDDLEAEAEIRGLSRSDIAIPSPMLRRLRDHAAAQELRADIPGRAECGNAVGEVFFRFFVYETTLPIELKGARATFGSRARDVPGGELSVVAEMMTEPGMGQSWFHNKAWPSYRSVAHFWAARHVEECLGESREFPCGRKQMARFLALAEMLLDWGSTHVPLRQTKPLLDKSSSWASLPDLLRQNHHDDAAGALVAYADLVFGK